ncbi:MAG: tyrosine-type recombinase/integrase [Proteobacteria bacterium]|nr:tyrosine-type recombinase/integrase [Pseudomonadota bacterium]
MAKVLTAAAITKLKADPAKRLEIPDAHTPGLYLVIQPSGRKSWAARFRVEGKPAKLTLGGYLAGTDAEMAGEELTAMRKAAADAIALARRGVDPTTARQEAEADAQATQFEVVVRDFIERHARKQNRTWIETARHLGLVLDGAGKLVAKEGGLVEKWGTKPIADIRKRDVIAHLDELVDAGNPIAANRRLAALKTFFSWAVGRDTLAASPCDGIAKPSAEVSRDRVLTPDELRVLLLACDKVGQPFGPMVRLLARTAQRREEVAGLRWKEIVAETWTIPAERAKNGKANIVHLDQGSRDALAEMPRIGKAGFVFTTTGDSSVSGFARAKSRLDAEMLKIMREADPEATLTPWKFHDLRRTAATGMARLGIDMAVVEKILNHTSGSFRGVAGVYQRHDFAAERQHALTAWGAHLDGLLKEQPSNVISMRAVVNQA